MRLRGPGLSLGEHEARNPSLIGHVTRKVSSAKAIRESAGQGPGPHWKRGQEGELHSQINVSHDAFQKGYGMSKG